MYIKDSTIENWLKEDVPYMDLTTHTLGIGGTLGKIKFVTREDGIICGSEEVMRLFKMLDVKTIHMIPSGTKIFKNQVVFEAEGMASNLHMGWKVALNIFEYASGISSRTYKLIELSKGVNPDLSIATTRKSFPGTKELSVKAVLVAGGIPHRLGLSETILVFKNHINLMGGMEKLALKIKSLKAKACEKRFLVEIEREEDAILLCEYGVDSLQFDKFSPDDLAFLVTKIKKDYPHVVLIATGGINEKNVEKYAATGVHAIATTSVYFGRPFDMGVKIVNHDS